jgi:hypothetical protein
LHRQVKAPPFTDTAQIKVGVLLRQLQQGENLEMPYSRPMPSIGTRCYKLRLRDIDKNWRIIYRIDNTSRETPDGIIDTYKKRLSKYERD